MRGAWTRSTMLDVGSTFSSIWWRLPSPYSTWNCCFSIPGGCQRPSSGHGQSSRGRIDFGAGHGVWRRNVFVVLYRVVSGLRMASRGASMATGVPHNSDLVGGENFSHDAVITNLDKLANWCCRNSVWPMPFATVCCWIELMATGASRQDLARFDAEVFRFSLSVPSAVHYCEGADWLERSLPYCTAKQTWEIVSRHVELTRIIQ